MCVFHAEITIQGNIVIKITIQGNIVISK